MEYFSLSVRVDRTGLLNSAASLLSPPRNADGDRDGDGDDGDGDGDGDGNGNGNGGGCKPKSAHATS